MLFYWIVWYVVLQYCMIANADDSFSVLKICRPSWHGLVRGRWCAWLMLSLHKSQKSGKKKRKQENIYFFQWACQSFMLWMSLRWNGGVRKTWAEPLFCNRETSQVVGAALRKPSLQKFCQTQKPANILYFPSFYLNLQCRTRRQTCSDTVWSEVKACVKH